MSPDTFEKDELDLVCQDFAGLFSADPNRIVTPTMTVSTAKPGFDHQ